jgi:hypothetical protein
LGKVKTFSKTALLKADPAYGEGVAKALGISMDEVGKSR